MMLSRLTCILIHVYALLVAEDDEGLSAGVRIETVRGVGYRVVVS
jgi:hypothetical protein